jgi:hypothetical protein
MPAERLAERKHILDIVFNEFLGIEFHLVQSTRTNVKVFASDAAGAIYLPDSFFARAHLQWAQPESLPCTPLLHWDSATSGLNVDLVDPLVPVIYGDPVTASVKDTELFLPIDIFGSCFFMLTRYEEIVQPVEDEHSRYPASASLAYKEGFLDRPIVDEYVEILWAAMKLLWPNLTRYERIGAIKVSCDVDRPFDPSLRSVGVVSRIVLGDVLRRRDVSAALRRIRRYGAFRRGDHSNDPFHKFTWYMAVCEAAGLGAAFYFIPARSDPRMDCHYEIEDPDILALIRDVHLAGHEVGTHGSYNTFRDQLQIQLERQRLVSAAALVGNNIEISGNRQHYLRWDSRVTPDYLDGVGYGYDTTGSFADMPGFRYGTSKPFSMWSWIRSEALRIQERPLVVMECSVIDDAYLGLGYGAESFDLMNRLKSRSMQFGGDFTLLWHNSHFLHDSDQELFRAILGVH